MYDVALWRIEKAERCEDTALDLRGLNLTTLPPEIWGLRRLQILYLEDNHLSNLPPEIGQLTNLYDLRFDNNLLTSLPQEIGELTRLRFLFLERHHLTSLPPDFHRLTNLHRLYLNGNKLTTLPPDFHRLSNLRYLNLSGNHLTSLPPDFHRLPNLNYLDLSENQLTSLPQELWQLPKLKKLYLYGNPLVSPPHEIIESGPEAIKVYFEQAGPTRPLGEVKLVLVGRGEAGKTSLVKALLGEPFDPNEDQTHGINIRDFAVPLESGDVRARIWDFGGQEIMHATHRFFLSRRSLFVVVLEGRSDEDPEYWLNHASTYSADAPVLVVLNKADLNPNYQLDFKNLKEKFPQIRGFYYTSCQDGTGIDKLKTALAQEIDKVPMIRTHWPENWIKVKEKLESNTKPFLDREQFSDMCRKAGIIYQGQEEVLVEFFNDLGVAIHFEGLNLDETHVLKPEWATNGVYRILNHRETAEQNGIVKTDRASLTRLLEIPVHEDQKRRGEFHYPRSKHPFLVDLMEKFELCFRLNRSEILIPDLLPKNEPDFEFDYQKAAKFRCRYEGFLPPTVMPRFMVKRHEEIQGALRWRTGMVIQSAACQARAVVRTDKNERQLLIWIEGAQYRDYLASLRETLAIIHKDFPTLKVRQEIGCPCHTCRLKKKPYFFEYDKLIAFYLKGNTDYPCNESEEMVSIAEILDGVNSGQAKQLDEIADMLRDLIREKGFEGSQWDQIKDAVDLKVGVLGAKVDLKKIFNIIRDSMTGSKK